MKHAIKILIMLSVALVSDTVLASAPVASAASASASASASSSCVTSQSSDPRVFTQILKDELNKAAPDFAQARTLVKSGADVNIILDANGTTPLMRVIQVGRNLNDPNSVASKCFRSIMRADADIMMRDIHNKSAGDYAREDDTLWRCRAPLRDVEIVHNVAECVRKRHSLEDYYATLNGINAACQHPINYKINGGGETSCSVAAYWNRTKDLQLLLDAPEVNIDERDTDGCVALHRAALYRSNVRALQQLIDRAAKINIRQNKDPYKRIVEFAYLDTSSIAAFELLFAHGVDYNVHDDLRNIHTVLSNRYLDKASMLIYYLMSGNPRPTRQQFATKQKFKDALDAWNNVFVAYGGILGDQHPMKTLIDTRDTVANKLSAEQKRQCDVTIAQRSRIMGGGNIMTLLRQREQRYMSATEMSLLQKRLVHRVSTLPEPPADVGDII